MKLTSLEKDDDKSNPETQKHIGLAKMCNIKEATY